MDKLPILLATFTSYHTLEETVEAIKKFIAETPVSTFNLFIAVPVSFLESIKKIPDFQLVNFGVDFLLDATENAFTASIAIPMLHSIGSSFVLIGSKKERLFYKNDSNPLKSKIKLAIASSVTPIICISHSQEQQEDNIYKDALKKELITLFSDLSTKELQNLHILYNAEWINQTPWEANNSFLTNAYNGFKEVLKEQFFEEIVDGFNLLYAVPRDSEEFKQIVESLPAQGYSLGKIS